MDGFFIYGGRQVISQREVTILRLAAMGAGQQAIADGVHLSLGRVGCVKREAVRKMGARSLAGAVYAATVQGLLSPVSSAHTQYARRLFAALPERDQALARLVAEGLCNKQIAVRLCRSLACVKARMTRLLDGLGVKNRVEVAHMVALVDASSSNESQAA